MVSQLNAVRDEEHTLIGNTANVAKNLSVLAIRESRASQFRAIVAVEEFGALVDTVSDSISSTKNLLTLVAIVGTSPKARPKRTPTTARESFMAGNR